MRVHMFDGSAAISADGHRGSDMKMDIFPVTTDATGNNMLISVGLLPKGRKSPPHAHNFDQIRYVLSGRCGYGGWEMSEGDCGYFPESVGYGPQTQDEDALVLTLQFPGDSGAYYPTPPELAAITGALKLRDPAFGTGGVGRDAGGEVRDAFELAWEALRDEPIAYAPPRFGAPIIMPTQTLVGGSDETRSVMHHLGTFGDGALRVCLHRLTGAGHVGPSDPAKATEFWFQLQGTAKADGIEYGARTGFLFQVGEQGRAAECDAATFLSIRFPERNSIGRGN